MTPRSYRAPSASELQVTGKRPLTGSEEIEDENRRKDPKISRACDICKRKKIRCDGTLPCNNCSRRKISCAYDAKYGRGRPPTPQSSTATDQRQEQQIPDRIDGLGAWKQLQLIEYDDLAPQVQSRASLDQEVEGQYFDPSSGLNFLHRAWKKLLVQKDESASYDSHETGRNQPLISAGDRPFRIDGNTSESFLPDGSSARKLQHFYFETCVVTYRIFHQQTVERWMEVFLKDQQDGKPLGWSLGHCRTAILLTIMAIATLRMEKVKRNDAEENETQTLQQSDRLFCAGMKLINGEMGFPRLESAQARLIQVLYLLQTARMNEGWYKFGNLFHITLSMGMHRRRDQKRDFPFNKRQNYISSECSKRTFWVAYILDKYLSVVFGRPRLYQDEDIDQNFPDSVNDEDMSFEGPAVSDDSTDCHVDALIFHAKIARIIGTVSREVYSVNDLPHQHRLAAAHRLGQELHEWRASLPPHLGTVKPSTLMPSFRRQAIALQLAYFHALIHTNRPFLLSEAAPESVSECLSATKASLELVNRMASDSALLYSFWWTHYVIFCALAVVYVWEIQRTTRSTNVVDEESLGPLFELAEKCRGHLNRASTDVSPNQRYSVILDELRSEALRCRLLRHNSHNIDPNGMQHAEANPAADFGSSMPNTNFVSDAHLLEEEAMTNVLDGFLFSDWQTLDSSAFFPLPDPDSVSPTCYPAFN
ncbi:unnamed protein product [Penicillium olsonii]|nr:unnamed protein product [Penicillium olsonii]